MPRQLARARGRNVGAPGRATYTVTRGGFGFALKDDALLVSTPINANISVCKPLGPLCPTYGRCSPRMTATARVPLLLSSQYTLGPSQVSISTQKGCTLQPIGLNVTPQLESTARGQARQVRQRIDSSLPPLRDDVAAVWGFLQHPIPIGTESCVKLRPTRVLQGRPRLDDESLKTVVAVEASLQVEGICTPQKERSTRLPTPEVSPELQSGFELHIPVVISWDDVSAELTRALDSQEVEGDGETLVLRKVETYGRKLEGHDRLLLGVTVSGPVCGVAWLTAAAEHNPKTGQLALRQVKLLDERQAFGPELGKALASRLEEKGLITLPVDVASIPQSLRELVQRLAGDLPSQVTAQFEPRAVQIPRVRAREEGLVAEVDVYADAAVVARAE